MSYPASDPSYLIIGCGHFGSRAAEKLFQKTPHPKIIIIDRNKKALLKVSRLPIEIAVSDAIFYLDEFLSRNPKAYYIIPAVPFHLAFEFILSQTKPLGARRDKVPAPAGLPNPLTGKTGDLYTSLADFLCSEDCPGPARYCAMTGERRPEPLYKILNNFRGAFESRVIRSQQLGPGIGGFRPGTLLDLVEYIKKKRISGQPILISTASRCHGVTSALSF